MFWSVPAIVAKIISQENWDKNGPSTFEKDPIWTHYWAICVNVSLLSFITFLRNNCFLNIYLTSLLKDNICSLKNDMSCSSILSSRSLIPLCGSYLTLCCRSFHFNYVFLWLVLYTSLPLLFGQLQRSTDSIYPPWPFKGHSVCMLFHFLLSAPKGPKSLRTAVREMREKIPLRSLQQLTQLLLIEHPDMSIRCL